MALITAEYGALTLAVTKASALAANNVVVAFVDEFNRGRKYSPWLMDGLQVQTGDAANKWLPYVGTVTAVYDPSATSIGQYLVTLIPGTADTVNVASVGTIRVDPNALFITASSTW